VKRNPSSKPELRPDESGAPRFKRATRRAAVTRSDAVTLQELRAVYQALRTTRAAMLNITQPVAWRHALGQRGFAIMGAMVRGIKQPGPLAAELGIGPSLLTAELQRLSEARMITRDHHPEDARRVRLELTDKGLQLVRDTEDALRSAISPMLKEYSVAERAIFLEILQRLGNVQPAPDTDQSPQPRVRAVRRSSGSRNSKSQNRV
jgi:DNA-binding MarR family transcriptional regulator